MLCHIPKASNLFILSSKVANRVCHQVIKSYSPSTATSAKLPIVTGIALPPGFFRSRSTISFPASIPWRTTLVQREGALLTQNQSQIREPPTARSVNRSTGSTVSELVSSLKSLGPYLAVCLKSISLHVVSFLLIYLTCSYLNR